MRWFFWMGRGWNAVVANPPTLPINWQKAVQMLFVLYWLSKNLSCDSWSLGTSSGSVKYLRHSAKVLELSQKFTAYAGFLPLEVVLTWEDGVVEKSSKTSVRTVLLNDPFEVNDLEEAPDKFDIGVDNNDDNAVEGVNAATTAVRQCFNFLSPFPGNFSGDWSIDLPSVFFPDPGMMMMKLIRRWLKLMITTKNEIAQCALPWLRALNFLRQKFQFSCILIPINVTSHIEVVKIQNGSTNSSDRFLL